MTTPQPKQRLVLNLIPQMPHLERKAYKSKSGGCCYLKPLICLDEALEQLGQAQVVLNVALQALLPIGSQHKPDLQCPEAPPQGHLPVLCQQPSNMHAAG